MLYIFRIMPLNKMSLTLLCESCISLGLLHRQFTDYLNVISCIGLNQQAFFQYETKTFTGLDEDVKASQMVGSTSLDD